ncbi:hypothetical protein E2562_011142 [Oryza meyeriana var. granulata]|uniref:Non-haem dioxygenase N-terminal domain-containing protein n=1 Tax=Oryza meyeriana var. granulata TaxID=110450 RepID=A0A6G1DGF4_9ORYZ|nr:hypothetical protein E2562_011142 [Oryza meyeriana var. granulata]
MASKPKRPEAGKESGEGSSDWGKDIGEKEGGEFIGEDRGGYGEGGHVAAAERMQPRSPTARRRRITSRSWASATCATVASPACPPADRPSNSRSPAILPVVDLAALRAGDPCQLAALDAACRDYGFFQVVNHGVAADVGRAMLDVARRFFFDLPLP